MSIPTRTLDQVLARALAHMRSSFPGFPMGAKKFLSRSARAFGLPMWGLQKAIEDVDVDIVPSVKSSNLADWAVLLGLPDGASGYGLAVPTISSGGAATLTGVQGTNYPDGTTATADDGVTQIALSGAVTIAGTPPGIGSADAIFISITTGSTANLPAGTGCTWDSVPAGADPSFTLTSPLEGGKDVEDNATAFSRILARLQDPPRGGNAEDITFWAQSVESVSVYVYPRRSGTGTVDVVITVAGQGTSRISTVDQLDTVQDSFDSNRPAGSEQITAIAPYMPVANGRLILVKVVPSSDSYAFDWDDTATAYTVAAYTPATNPILQLSTAIPATLQAAVTAYIANPTSQPPRLQVLSDGALAVNPSVGVIAFNSFTNELTLESPSSSWMTPTVGDTVYAYGPVVATIAARIQDIVDTLGPSRLSGFGDAVLTWQDKLTISSLINAAVDAADTDGTALIDEVKPGDATIDGLAADVEGQDNGFSNPELLYASHIAIVAAS